jgi:hypothetical protein
MCVCICVNGKSMGISRSRSQGQRSRRTALRNLDLVVGFPASLRNRESAHRCGAQDRHQFYGAPRPGEMALQGATPFSVQGFRHDKLPARKKFRAAGSPSYVGSLFYSYFYCTALGVTRQHDILSVAAPIIVVYSLL